MFHYVFLLFDNFFIIIRIEGLKFHAIAAAVFIYLVYIHVITKKKASIHTIRSEFSGGQAGN